PFLLSKLLLKPSWPTSCSQLNWRDVSMGPGVTANCFHPGLVATGFNRNNGLLMDLGMMILRPVSRSPEKAGRTVGDGGISAIEASYASVGRPPGAFNSRP